MNFPKANKTFGGNVEVELDLSSYATKTDLKKSTWIDTSNLAAKLDLASLKAKRDNIYGKKLKTVPVNWSKLSNVVNNDVVTKTGYDNLVSKANSLNTSGFVLETKCDIDKSDLEKN